MAEQIAQCPKCMTSFRVTPEQLQMAGGRVRCGYCRHVFDAARFLVPEQEQSVELAATSSAIESSEFNISDPDFNLAFDDHGAVVDATLAESSLFDLEEKSTTKDERQKEESQTALAFLAATRELAKEDSAVDASESELLQTSPEQRFNPEALTPSGSTSLNAYDTAVDSALNLAPQSINEDRSLDLESVDVDVDVDVAELQQGFDRSESQLLESAEGELQEFPVEQDRGFSESAFLPAADEVEIAEPEVSPLPSQDSAESDSVLTLGSHSYTRLEEDDLYREEEINPESRFDDYGDINAELDFDDVATPPMMAAQAKNSLSWASVALSVLLVIVFASQYVAFNFHDLARNTAMRPLLSGVCSLAGCAVPPFRDIDKISSEQLTVRTHPEQDGALVVDVIVTNGAELPQPFPALQLTFFNIRSEPVATRKFFPGEFLHGELRGLTSMPNKNPIHLALEVMDPGAQAINYELKLVELP